MKFNHEWTTELSNNKQQLITYYCYTLSLMSIYRFRIGPSSKGGVSKLLKSPFGVKHSWTIGGRFIINTNSTINRLKIPVLRTKGVGLG